MDPAPTDPASGSTPADPAARSIPADPAAPSTPADGSGDAARAKPFESPLTAGDRSARSRLITAMTIFTALRLGLVVVLTLMLMLVVPFIIALAVAVVLQLPISMLLFARQRAAVNQALATSWSVRRAERAELRAALRGQDG